MTLCNKYNCSSHSHKTLPVFPFTKSFSPHSWSTFFRQGSHAGNLQTLSNYRMSWSKGVVEFHMTTFFSWWERNCWNFTSWVSVALLFTENHQEHITFIKEIVSELSVKKAPRIPFIYPGWEWIPRPESVILSWHKTDTQIIPFCGQDLKKSRKHIYLMKLNKCCFSFLCCLLYSSEAF